MNKYIRPLFETNTTIAGFEANKLPINKPVPFDPELLMWAITTGNCIILRYKGAKNLNPQGLERTIYPLIWGKLSNTNDLQYIRAWHLTGWSVSKKTMAMRTWRMFRVDRILSMTLTSSFFRFPPEGFKPDSPGFPIVIKMADFRTITQKQNEYFKQKNERVKAEAAGVLAKIQVQQTGEVLDLDDPYKIEGLSNSPTVSISILKKKDENKYIAISGIGGAIGAFVEVVDGTMSMGEFGIIKILTGPALSGVGSIEGQKLFPYYNRK